MKKSVIFAFFWMFLSITYCSLSQNWAYYTPAPCPANIQHGTLTGPKEYVIRGDTTRFGGNLDHCNDCVYHIIYYDNYDYIMAQTPPCSLDYDVSVVGIFYEGVGCSTCVTIPNGSYLTDAIIRAFFESIYYTKLSEPAFKQRVNHHCDTEIIYTPAECKNGDLPCSDDNYCCETYVRIVWDQPSLWPTYYNWDYFNRKERDNPKKCDTVNGCVFKCKNIPFVQLVLPDSASDCVAPCNTGYWVVDSRNIPIDGCPGCSVKVDFRYRTAECELSYFDYQVDSLRKVGCDNCTMNGGAMFEYAVHWLLKYGPHALPEPEQCRETYRVFNSSCWEWHNDTCFVPCDSSGCCWSVYRICNFDPVYLEKIAQSDDDTLWCEMSNSCIFICDYDLPRISIPEEGEIIRNDKNSKAVLSPNPNNCKADLEIENNYSGDIVLEITNSIGEIVMNEKYLKNGYNISVDVNIVNCTGGTYFYRIIQNDVIVGKGSFVVIK